MVKTNKQHHHHRHIVIIFRSRSGSKWGTWTQTQRPWTVASALSVSYVHTNGATTANDDALDANVSANAESTSGG